MTIRQDFYDCNKLYSTKPRAHEVYNQIMLMTPIFNLDEAFYVCWAILKQLFRNVQEQGCFRTK
jgi:hypothetical protein